LFLLKRKSMLQNLLILSLYVNFIVGNHEVDLRNSEAIPVSKIGPDTILTRRKRDKPKNEIEEYPMTFNQLYGNGKWALIARLQSTTQPPATTTHPKEERIQFSNPIPSSHRTEQIQPSTAATTSPRKERAQFSNPLPSSHRIEQIQPSTATTTSPRKEGIQFANPLPSSHRTEQIQPSTTATTSPSKERTQFSSPLPSSHRSANNPGI
jgi:hypothetical protein